jgi:hypothetical protein
MTTDVYGRPLVTPTEHPAKRRIRLSAEYEAELYPGKPLIVCVDDAGAE